MRERRQRIHELVLALLARQADLELLDGEDLATGPGSQANTAGWLERNRRILQHYQALVRTATTLDALVDQELGGGLGQTVHGSRSATAAQGERPG